MIQCCLLRCGGRMARRSRKNRHSGKTGLPAEGVLRVKEVRGERAAGMLDELADVQVRILNQHVPAKVCWTPVAKYLGSLSSPLASTGTGFFSLSDTHAPLGAPVAR